MHYRKAEVKEAEELAQLRKKQLIDEGIKPNRDIDAELVEFFVSTLTSGELIEWVVEDEGKIIATAAVLFQKFPPSFSRKTGLKAYVTNMYTNPNYRGQGIATELLSKLKMEAENKEASELWLGASTMGKPVYQNFGFEDITSYMYLPLK